MSPYFFLSFIRVASLKQLITVSNAAKPPKARSRRSERIERRTDDYATVEGIRVNEEGSEKSEPFDNIVIISSRTGVRDELP